MFRHQHQPSTGLNYSIHPLTQLGGEFISDLKAGDLLGRSNEELVLLLIQLRRQSSAISAAQLRTSQQLTAVTSGQGHFRDQSPQRTERLQAQLKELDKQHELTRPIISLVDNMLKLSSMYEAAPDGALPLQQRRRLSQRVQERRWQREEQRHWQTTAAQPCQMQARVQQLFTLDQQLTGQAARIQQLRVQQEGLQRRMAETCVEGGEYAPARDSERLQWRRRALQQELGRVRAALTSSARGLEETAAESGRLERQMMQLRQRLQTAVTGDSGALGRGGRSQEVRALEKELRHVQTLVDQLTEKRQRLSRQVAALTQPERPQHAARRHSGWQQTDVDLPQPRRSSPGPGHTDLPLFVSTSLSQQAWLSGTTDVTEGAPPPPAPAGPLSPAVAVDTDDAGPEDKVSLDSGLNSSSPTDHSQQSVARESTPGGDCEVMPPQQQPQQPPKPPPPPPLQQQQQQQQQPQKPPQQHPPPHLPPQQQQEQQHPPPPPPPPQQLWEAEERRRPPCRDRLSGQHQHTSSQSGGPAEGGDAGAAQWRVGREQQTSPVPAPHRPAASQNTADRYTNVHPSTRQSTIVPSEKQHLQHRLHQLDQVHQRQQERRQQQQHSHRQQQQQEERSMQQQHPHRKQHHQEQLQHQEEHIYQQQQERPMQQQAKAPDPEPEPLDDRQSPSISSDTEPQQLADADVRMQRFYGIIPKEKSLEIKTVRIVKRESQLRQRERPARRASDDWQLPALAEAERWRRSTSLPRSGPWPSPSPDAVRRIPDFRHHLLKRLVDRARSADDMDVWAGPELVRCTRSRAHLPYHAATIDALLAAPQKIHIPERYVPELEVEPASAEEQSLRSQKAASIRRMLTASTGFLDTIGTSESAGGSAGQERLQRAHILQLNQVLAKQVTERSKRVAVATAVH